MKALGIDIGTTTISAAVVDKENGKVEKAYTVSNGSFIKTENPMEKIQDPEKIKEKAFLLAEEILAAYPDISIIGLTGQMHGIVYVDSNGHCVSPLYTWQDERGSLPCFDGESICGILKREGALSGHTGYGLITHCYNVRKNIVPENAAGLCTIMDYIAMLLTGRKKPIVHISNAGSLGLYDVERGAFQENILHKMGVDTSILPEITDQFEIVGTFRDIPVCVAIGDNQASFLGSVDDAANAILVNMGTGGQISVLSDKCIEAERIETRPFAKGKYLLAGSSLCGGKAYMILRDFFRSYADAIGASGIDHYQAMGKLLQDNDLQGMEKLRVSTTFSGTREDPMLSGSITSIRAENFTPANLIRGFLEGMAEELYGMYQTIQEKTETKHKTIIASGNGLRKNLYLQDIIRERFSMELRMAAYEEEAACGAALAGFVASGVTSLQELMGIS